MMKKRSVMSFLVSVFLAAALLSQAVPAAADEETEPYKIGFSQATMASPFYVAMVDAFEKYCGENGVEPVASSAEEDAAQQNQDILDMVDAGIDALILNPISLESVQPGIDACVAAGIPVITVDRTAASGGTAVVRRDNREMGRLVGERLLEELGGPDEAEGIILELQGTAGDQVMTDRHEGFASVFEDVEGIVIAESESCDYVRTKAVEAARDMIEDYSDRHIVAIYGHNDDMAIGGMQAAKEAGLDDVLVCGIDGLMEAVEAIAGGEGYLCTALNDPAAELRAAADTALKILNGEEYEEVVDAGTVLVDPANAEEYADESLSFAAMK